MKIAILLQNVHEMNSPEKVAIICKYIRNLIPRVEILCFQVYSQEAAVAYRTSQSKEGASSREVCMQVAPDIAPLVLESEHVMLDRT
uniref:Uncharacterized protein n=1 Tax=Physcomitrium patens TaxID=3218 RepID=A0A2K1J7X4_PHYPA|nr:hypothetical protein PHYPA_020728 [Physcomitrium patens]